MKRIRVCAIPAVGALLGVYAAFDRSTALIAGVVLGIGAVWLMTISAWRRAFYGLLVYLPFAGIVTLALYPSPAPLVFKDLLFVIPAYAGFAWSWGNGHESVEGMPRSPLLLMLVLSAIVVVQCANPSVTNALVALIGLKVWLLYLPLVLLSFALMKSERDLERMCKVMIALSFVPCAVGIGEFLMAQIGGYQETISAIYGASAGAVSQRFSRFSIGGKLLVRIPSTFTFVTQYFGFTLAMIVPSYSLMRLDGLHGWGRVAAIALATNVVASFLCGARSAFVFVPLLVFLTLLLDGRLSGAAIAGMSIGGLALGAVSLLGFSLSVLYGSISELLINYAETTAYGALMKAVTEWPLGAGTGTNTGPARYAYSDAAFRAALPNYETYYGKTAHELGIAGLLVIVALFGVLVIEGIARHRFLRSPGLRGCSAAIIAFLITISLNSFKGWQIDLDPVNVYFWVFAGVLFALPFLDSEAARTHQQESRG